MLTIGQRAYQRTGTAGRTPRGRQEPGATRRARGITSNDRGAYLICSMMLNIGM